MRNLNPLLSTLIATGLALLGTDSALSQTQAPMKMDHDIRSTGIAGDTVIADPTSVVMIVNRDSNEIAFMDIKSKKIIAKTFLGNNVNPHMVMMSPDGRYVVTGGTRANKAYIIDTRTTKLVKE